MQVLQAGRHKLILLEIDPATVSAVALQAGFEAKLKESPRSILLELLNMLGHSTDEAGTAEEALRICAGRSFDVLLTDYKLPGMTGLELARQVHQGNKATRIVFSSGHGPELMQNAGFPCKALIKPFSVEALQDVLA